MNRIEEMLGTVFVGAVVADVLSHNPSLAPKLAPTAGVGSLLGGPAAKPYVPPWHSRVNWDAVLGGPPLELRGDDW